MSTTLGYPAVSRSSTVHVVLAPVAAFVTVNTVPKGRVGLAHIPGGAAPYQVACPLSLLPLVVGTGGAVTGVTGVTLGATVVVVTGACSTAGVNFGTGVVAGVVEGATVVGVVGATGVVVGVVLAAAAA
jgi:hypothetical protein